MSNENALATQERPLTIREPSPAALLDSAIERGMSPEGIEKLVNLYTRMDDRRREQAFGDALTELQRECQNVKAIKPVMNKAEKGGGVRFSFAPYEEIMAEVKPLLEKYKFALSFDSDFLEGGRVQVFCKLTHEGHSQTSRFACRVGDGPPGASAPQGDGAAVTYAKRFALCLALNIVVDKIFDGADARPIGDFIPPEMAADLERRAEKFPKKIPFLLALGEAETFQQLCQGAYKRVNKALVKWETAAKEQPASNPPASPKPLPPNPGTAPCDSEGNLL
jgi:ERF superfamily